MSTELLEDELEGMYLTRFYGSTEKGLSYQITMTDQKHKGFVQLTDKQMAQIISAYVLSKANGKV